MESVLKEVGLPPEARSQMISSWLPSLGKAKHVVSTEVTFLSELTDLGV